MMQTHLAGGLLGRELGYIPQDINPIMTAITRPIADNTGLVSSQMQ
jgi:hypothetical protein